MVSVPYVESNARIILRNINIPLVDSYSKDGKIYKSDRRTFRLRLSIKCGDKELLTPIVENLSAKMMNIEFPDEYIFDNVPSNFIITISVLSLRPDLTLGNTLFDKLTSTLTRSIGNNNTIDKNATYNSKYGTISPNFIYDYPEDQNDLLQRVAKMKLSLNDANHIKETVYRLKRIDNFTMDSDKFPPLFGTISLSMIVQPKSLLTPLKQGFVNVTLCLQNRILRHVYCILKGGSLTIFNTSPQHSKDGTIEIPVNNDTVIHLDKRNDSIVLSAIVSKNEMVKEIILDVNKNEEVLEWCKALSTQIVDTKVYGDATSKDYYTIITKGYKNSKKPFTIDSPFSYYETLLSTHNNNYTKKEPKKLIRYDNIKDSGYISGTISGVTNNELLKDNVTNYLSTNNKSPKRLRRITVMDYFEKHSHGNSNFYGTVINNKSGTFENKKIAKNVKFISEYNNQQEKSLPRCGELIDKSNKISSNTRIETTKL
uniref:Anillin domain-containing protein n=1 Tax=Parastrongyloides trichosuri TaxID=131310 RepID=A0A0N4ZP19_PARTI